MPKRKKTPRKKKKYSALIFVLFIIVLIGFGAYYTYRFFSLSTWDGKNQINLVLAGKSTVAVISFLPSENNLKIVNIPQGALMETAGGYGKYRAEALYLLDQIEKKNGRLLMGSFQELLLLPIDGWIYYPEFFPEANNPELVLKNLKETVRYREKSNLSNWDLWRLIWRLRSVDPARMKTINLEKIGAVLEQDLPDGTTSIQLDIQLIEDSLGDQFIDPTVRQENVTVSVVNASGISGQATKGGKIIERMGGRLIKIGDHSDSALNGCEIRSLHTPGNSYTMQRLIKVFGCVWKNESLEGNRADIILLLGNR